MRRAVLPWIVAGALLIVVSAVAGGVVAAQVTSASAFVRVYLDALARGDGASAARMPGVAGDPVAAASAMPGLGGIRVLSDTDVGQGRHRVAVAWTSAGQPGQKEQAGQTTFTVEQAGSTALVFPAWRFAVSPTSTLALTLSGDDRVVVGSHQVTVARGRAIALLVPGGYTLRMDSPLATTGTRDVLADRAGARLSATLTASPSTAFRARILTDVRSALRACARQQALYPAGCPFGASITDRIASTPAWTIEGEPSLALTPDGTTGRWRATVSGGTARLRVDVRSLYDGTVSTKREDVEIAGTWTVTVTDDTPRLGALEQSP